MKCRLLPAGAGGGRDLRFVIYDLRAGRGLERRLSDAGEKGARAARKIG